MLDTLSENIEDAAREQEPQKPRNAKAQPKATEATEVYT